MRAAYTFIQQGKKPKMKLSQDRIERLEAIGFQWRLKVIDYDEAFEQRCCDLKAFKSEFGHCDVPYTYSADPVLGQWCTMIRYNYNLIQQGKKPRINLSQDRIDRLNEVGFEWKVKVIKTYRQKTFEQRCCDLEAFKSEFGHYNVPYKYSVDPSLGYWCTKIRSTYNKIQKGKARGRHLPQYQIDHLNKIGFNLKGIDYEKMFELQHCRELEAFNSEFGHCNVPSVYSGFGVQK